eukprot:858450-Pelagomonas_calceolata.AAC.2
MDASSTAAGEKVYGLFGHGSFLAVGALSYNAFWQCKFYNAGALTFSNAKVVAFLEVGCSPTPVVTAFWPSLVS